MSDHTLRSTARRAMRGVTLIELMVVLALMAVLMGLGISMYTNLGARGMYSATVANVLTTINRVRNSSMTHPAALQVYAGDPDRGEMSGVRGIEFVTLWQSQMEAPADDMPEDELVAALGRTGRLPAGVQFVPGIVGDALFLEGGGYVDCGNHPAYDATEGVSIDVWVHPLSERGGTIVHRGDSLGVVLKRRADGLGLVVQLRFADTGGAIGDARSVTPATRRFEVPVDIPLKEWTRIVVAYDRTAVTVAIDRGRGPVERLRERETAALLPAEDSNLTIGGGGGRGTSFHGYIDDLRIDGVIGGEMVEFPAQIRLDGSNRRIHFTGGKLDPAHHTRPEELEIVAGERRRRIVIGREGNILDK